jgi:hypothetical protein
VAESPGLTTAADSTGLEERQAFFVHDDAVDSRAGALPPPA